MSNEYLYYEPPGRKFKLVWVPTLVFGSMSIMVLIITSLFFLRGGIFYLISGAVFVLLAIGMLLFLKFALVGDYRPFRITKEYLYAGRMEDDGKGEKRIPTNEMQRVLLMTDSKEPYGPKYVVLLPDRRYWGGGGEERIDPIRVAGILSDVTGLEVEEVDDFMDYRCIVLDWMGVRYKDLRKK